MKNSLAVGRIAGIGIFIHWTFPIIILWIIFINVRQGQSTQQISKSVAFVLVLFVCVTLHELGHALAARRYNIKTKDITLLPVGGVARLENVPEKPWIEMMVAFAGPAVNIAIFLLLYSSFYFANLPFSFGNIVRISGENFWYNLALLNLWVALFNLVPAFPMDGGRILRAALALWVDRLMAITIANLVARAIAVLFMIGGFLYNPFLLLIGLFIFWGASAENKVEADDEGSFLQDYCLGEVAATVYPVVDASSTIGHVAEMVVHNNASFFIVMDGSGLLGVITRKEIIQGLYAYGADAAVSEIVLKKSLHIDANETVEYGMLQMKEHQQSVILVTKENVLYGVVDRQRVIDFIVQEDEPEQQ